MAENKMKEVAKLLGVEIGEYFNIKGAGYNPYTLGESELCNKNNACVWSYLLGLLTGEYEIEQLHITMNLDVYIFIARIL